MSTPANIIQALTARLTASGLPVYQGLVLDPMQDLSQDLPAVIIHQDKSGDKAIRTRPRLVREMGIIVEAWIRVTTDATALEEILAYGEQVRAIAAPFDSFDAPDTLASVAQSIVFDGLTGYRQERRWGVAEIKLTIQYGG